MTATAHHQPPRLHRNAKLVEQVASKILAVTQLPHCHASRSRYASFMRALFACSVACLLLTGVSSAQAASTDASITEQTPPPPGPPTDGVRPEDVMIDDDAIGDVWETSSPADTIGITAENASVLPSVTSALSSAELLLEKELLKPPHPGPKEPERLRTKRWRPKVPIQTLFYLALAVIVVTVLLLKARG